MGVTSEERGGGKEIGEIIREKLAIKVHLSGCERGGERGDGRGERT